MTNIDHLRGGQPLNTSRTANQTKTATTNTPQAAVVEPQHDAVSLSSQGKAVGKIHQQLAAETSFDATKVAEIKQAIANGSYTIDADKLASNMIKFEDELNGL
ncbi:flagellar biosynthesis anti-sigma factor FlgM [Photobacterium iliopiscarium]|jgi:negative regulator of flagellin synthesis FlgM|uniref:Negative regulator of flagellin synthesis n=1 Tax=Photobacterium iliopiscarium TaxID=56192 RepID=A0A0D8PCS4_9GAMM|nr:flagellar biosynthesis anti-sigma factor FlgM [Photobacterium iliopiscarium]KJG14839.1 flagellar biosynthesis anti-sigma factor FlgM [Photobacterium iliopiscarium]KJG23559.1 flagellar biosynthesis anti-sigma factor FlgM [Photobacterium iliopiscarium]PST96939.1 flagellar biosynthesis anti-sigma factor FlgM [Photobacterium iliopiscarium]PSU02124.1 flagellar biosynthesis anti-sigma factor FlgM [Photobacterium iliopiscarium]PSV84473.1 flagellar biosynthesis anti-sigma factor FlgM [Photobacteriu